MKHYNALNGHPPLGISIGFAVADSCPFSMRDLFKTADANMYMNKCWREQKTDDASSEK
jgi:hypothetical protein